MYQPCFPCFIKSNFLSINYDAFTRLPVDFVFNAFFIFYFQINKTIDSLENPEQQDFIRACLEKDPSKRPTVKRLLFHPALFEVHSLKLLAAHALLNGPNDRK